MYKSAFYELREFDCLDGAAKEHWDKCSEVKVCITARDAILLRKLITKIARDEDCFIVKMSKRPRDEMFIARCFFTTRENSGLIWAKYKKHP